MERNKNSGLLTVLPILMEPNCLLFLSWTNRKSPSKKEYSKTKIPIVDLKSMTMKSL